MNDGTINGSGFGVAELAGCLLRWSKQTPVCCGQSVMVVPRKGVYEIVPHIKQRADGCRRMNAFSHGRGVGEPLKLWRLLPPEPARLAEKFR